MKGYVKTLSAVAWTVALFLSISAGASAAPTGKPDVEAFWTRNVTATSADLYALVNPHGGPATYRFEYGTTVSYGTSVPVPDGDIPSSTVAQQVTAHIAGLNGGTYHFRLIAENELGETTTGDQTFTFYPQQCPNSHLRQQTGSSLLPDCRAYELVTPANSGNAELMTAAPFSPSATSPSRFAFSSGLGVIPGTGEPQNAHSGDLFVATRRSGGWVSRYVGIPGDQGSQVGGPPSEGFEQIGLSAAGTGEPAGVHADPALETFLDWDNGRGGFLCCGEKGSFAPFMWDSEGNFIRRLPTNLDEIPEGAADVKDGGFIGAVRTSDDFSHYFFSSANVAFTPDGLTTDSGSAYDNDIATETVSKISVLSNGQDIPHEPGALTPDYLNLPAASADGSHVLIEAPKDGICGKGTCGPIDNVCDPPGAHDPYMFRCPTPLPSHLYMRVDNAVTYDLSESHATTFYGMTPDGSEVFLSSSEPLTADDTDSSADLYVWREDATPHMTRISTGTSGAGNADACSAAWIDGCGAEFVSTKVAKHGAGFAAFNQAPSDDTVTASGDTFFYSPELLVSGEGTAGERNLYYFRNGQVQYVATLTGDAAIKRIQISPDGAHAAFLTFQRLTSYDNSSESGICFDGNPDFGEVDTGPRCLEIYTYDPATGTILCASCNPDGNRPAGDAEASWNGRFMADDGRVFFSTPEALVKQDTDGLIDTYEFVDNRPQLISSGVEASDRDQYQKAGLISVSGDGVDVYFATTATLVGQDKNGQFFKYYDARTGGGFPYTPPVAPCAAADECHGPESTPASAIVNGTGEPLGTGGNVRSVKQKKRHRKRHRHHDRQKKTHRHQAGAAR